jgi:hypothetical protein
MRTLTLREKRVVLYGGIGVGLYLLVFGGYLLGKPLAHRSAAYEQLVAQARSLQQNLKPYDDRAQVVKKMMDHFQLDPAKLSRATVVGEASAQLQKAAAGSGIQVGPVRESPMKASAKELATLQFEGTGPVPAVLGLLKRMETLGFPLVIDSVQITPDTMRPGQVKITLTAVVLDFEQWKTEDKPHA